MTVRWIEGFEIDDDVDYFRGKYQNRPNAIAVQNDGRIFGNSAQMLTLVTPPLISSPGPEWVIGFGIKLGGSGDPDADFVKLFNGGLDQIGIHFRADRTIEVRRGSTILATSVVVLPNNDWAYIEFKCLVDTSAGSYELRIDGTTELVASGIDTSFSNLNDADVVKFAGISNHRIDDIYILDTAGGDSADFLGPRVVEGLLPFAEGDTLQWTPSAASTHYVLVDDPADAFNVADYNESATVGQQDLYVFQALENITGDIDAVSVNCMIGLDGMGSRTYRTFYRNKDNAEGDGPTFTVDSTLPLNQLHILEQDPSGTPDRWTLDDILAGQFGVEVVS